MSWGYRKRVRFLPGIRLNVGKRGARVSASFRGTRSASVGWKGLFWRKKL